MKSKNFIIIVLGQIISLLGNTIQRFCMSLYILELTGSAAVFSTILAISTIPYIVFAPIAGLMADVVNRKKIMVYLDFFTSGLLVIYSLIIFSGQDNIMIVASVMFILSIVYTLYSPAVSASIPQIVKKEELTSANGIVQQVGYVANLLGPILAGVLYSLIGIRVVVVINAVCFFISALMELFLDIPDVAEKKEFKNPFLDSFTEMKRAFIYLKEEKKVVLGIICFYGLTNIFVVPVTTIITPYFINIVLAMPPEIYGFIEAIFVSGMILGGLLITFKPRWFNMKTIHKTMYPMVVAIVLMGMATYLKTDNKSLVLGIYSFGGFGIMLSLALSNILSLTYIQQSVKIDMLGKVSALSTAIATISVPPGQVIFGQLIDQNISLYMILILVSILSLGVVGFIKWNVRDIVEL